MNNAMTSFTFQTSPTKGPNHKHDIRVVTIGNDPWFSGMDVLDVLGLYPSEYRRLSDDQKTNLPRTQLGLAAGRPLVMLSESGLYKLIMRSDKPQAKRFQDWVTKDVLPAIRKDANCTIRYDHQPYQSLGYASRHHQEQRSVRQ